MSSSSQPVRSESVDVSRNLASAAAVEPKAEPYPKDFKPKNNPAFILHGKLETSFEELPVPQVGPDEVLVEVKKTVSFSNPDSFLSPKRGKS